MNKYLNSGLKRQHNAVEHNVDLSCSNKDNDAADWTVSVAKQNQEVLDHTTGLQNVTLHADDTFTVTPPWIIPTLQESFLVSCGNN